MNPIFTGWGDRYKGDSNHIQFLEYGIDGLGLITTLIENFFKNNSHLFHIDFPIMI